MTRLSQRALEAFRAVIETGTVSGAADSLNVSQPAVSRLIKVLEDSTGLNLFTRMGGRIVPTSEARELVIEVERAFIGLSEIEQAADDIRKGLRSTVAIGSMPALAHSILPDTLLRLRQQRPEFRLSLNSMQTGNVIRQVSSRQCQLGFASPTWHEFDIDLIRTVELPYRCIMPAGHPLADRTVLNWSDFAGRPVVGFSDATVTGRIMDRNFLELVDTPLVFARSHLSTIVSEMVLRGMGMSVVDPFTARTHESRGGVSCRLAEAARFQFSIIQPHGQGRGSDLDLLLELFEEELAGYLPGAAPSSAEPV